MIRIAARYEITTDDLWVMDQASDGLMDALIVRGDIFDPDVAVSMAEPKTLEIWFEVPTDNPHAALASAIHVLSEVFEKAGLAADGFRVVPLGASAHLDAELVAV